MISGRSFQQLSAASAVLANPAISAGQAAMSIGGRFIAGAENISLSVNPPVKRPGAVIHSDKPWDAFRIIWFTVAEDQGQHKM